MDNERIDVFCLLDQVCAQRLNVDVETFIEKIESTTERKADIIINILLYENSTEKQVEKARRCFLMIK